MKYSIKLILKKIKIITTTTIEPQRRCACV